MLKRSVFLIPTLLVFFLSEVGLAQSAGAQLDQLQWFLGTWKRESAKSITIEKWVRLSERTFEGGSVRISKASGDTTFTESLLLAEMAGGVFYIPKVAENKYPVPFKMVSIDGKVVVFENPSHDFPQRIIYRLNENGSMTATVESMPAGSAEPKRIEFHFTKTSQ